MDDKDCNQFNLLVVGGNEKGMRDAAGKAISKMAVVDVMQKHEILSTSVI